MLEAAQRQIFLVLLRPQMKRLWEDSPHRIRLRIAVDDLGVAVARNMMCTVHVTTGLVGSALFLLCHLSQTASISDAHYELSKFADVPLPRYDFVIPFRRAGNNAIGPIPSNEFNRDALAVAVPGGKQRTRG